MNSYLAVKFLFIELIIPQNYEFFNRTQKAPPTTVLAAEGVCVTCVFDGTNQGEALYIINSKGIAYHQLRKKLYIIKPT